MRLLIIFLILLGAGRGFTQTGKADSLERILPKLTGVDRATALYDLGLIYSRSDFSKLARIGDESGKLKDSPDQLVRTYALLAVSVYHSATGKNDSAIVELNEAKKLAHASGDGLAAIRVCGTLGLLLVGGGTRKRD